MVEVSNIEKIDLDKVDWRGSRDFFESLGEVLGRLDDKDEAYDFTWVGKRKAIIEAGAPINKTFRPNIEVSKNWDKTENLFIEGDNLDALKLLQESYLRKVKMIYIDPPYNTGKDFVYRDNFKASVAAFDEAIDYKDEEGNIQFKKNEKSNGRYHSDWLNMMYPRLKLARNLLTDDGVIFISIDDNEKPNLRKLCDEIFGEDNFIATVVWQKIHASKNQARYLSENHEYILVYAKSIQNFEINSLPRTAEMDARYTNTDNDPRGPWQSGDLIASGERTNGHFIVTSPISGKEFDVPSGKHWSYSEENMKLMLLENRLFFGKDGNAFPRKKQYLEELESKGRVANTIWLSSEVGNTQTATKELKKLFDGNLLFDYPKPTNLIKQAIRLGTKNNEIVMDFFAGSSATAHAVTALNAEDNNNRRWIMVQLPEEIDENAEAFQAGYKTIAEFSRERIRRAGVKIAKDNPGVNLDYGFRALTIADTNYKDVYHSAGEVTQGQLLGVVDNIKDDRTELDLLFGVLTASALELNRPLETKNINGNSVYLYDYFSEVSGLIACFSESISEDILKDIASLKPLTAVFRESSFSDSQSKINLAEHFRIISPETKVKVI